MSKPPVGYTLENIPDPNIAWSSIYRMVAKTEDGQDVGGIVANFICRNNIRKNFWTEMQNGRRQAIAASNEWGCVRDEYLYGKKQGLGCWDSKLNDGSLLIIEQFYLHSMPDRAEVAKNMIIDLCSRAVDYYPDVGNVIIGPECISPSATFQFFRSAGFRRIGASKWLATSIDKDHPAKLIDEQDDLDPFPALPTELEKLETSLEQRRTRGRKDGKRVEISDEFRGHSTTNIKKLLELRNLSVQDADAFRRARFGCTCGSCIGGYISPRMAYTLTKTAQRIFHALVQITECHDNRKKFQAAIISGQDFHGRDVKDTLAYNTWKYLPDPCRERILVVQDEARGHYEIFAAIFNTLLLRAVPDRQQIVRGFKLSTMVDAGLDNYCQTQQLPSPHVRPRHVFEAYESGGGTLEPVFNRLFDLSLFQDEKAGNNTFQLDAQYAQEYPALPRCRNDSEYGFVKGMLLQ